MTKNTSNINNNVSNTATKTNVNTSNNNNNNSNKSQSNSKKPEIVQVKPVAQQGNSSRPSSSNSNSHGASWATVASKPAKKATTLPPGEDFDPQLLQRWQVAQMDDSPSQPTKRVTAKKIAAKAPVAKKAEQPQRQLVTHWVIPAGADKAANDWMLSLAQYECAASHQRKPSLLSKRTPLAPKTSFQELIQAMAQYPFSSHGPADRSTIPAPMPRGNRAIAEFMRGLAHYPCLRHRHRQPRLPMADTREIAQFMYGLINYPCMKTRARYLDGAKKPERKVVVKSASKTVAKKASPAVAVAPQFAARYSAAAAADNQRMFARYDVPTHRIHAVIITTGGAKTAVTRGAATTQQASEQYPSLESLFKLHSSTQPATTSTTKKTGVARSAVTTQQSTQQYPSLESLFKLHSSTQPATVASTSATKKAAVSAAAKVAPVSATKSTTKTAQQTELPSLESLFKAYSASRSMGPIVTIVQKKPTMRFVKTRQQARRE
jgi:hypothetical protein